MSTNQSIKNPNVSTLGAVKTALPPAAFARIDETDDRLFYAEPRIVTHIDDNVPQSRNFSIEPYPEILPYWI